MTELRAIRPGDVQALAGLWSRVFGDPEALALAFLRRLPALGVGAAALRGGAIVGAAYCVTDLVYCADGRERRVGYLYAVGVDERSRSLGLGSALSREAVRLGKEAGAELICTSPAEDSLFAWYEKTLGLRRTLRRRRIRLDSRPGISPDPLTPAEYGRRREALLAGRPHLRPGAQALDFQQDCLRLGGGGFFALGAGLAAACAEDGEALLAELLNASEEDAASLGASLGCARTTLLRPSETGERFLAAAEPLAPESVWSFLFE